jgi:hypothetical protein
MFTPMKIYTGLTNSGFNVGTYCKVFKLTYTTIPFCKA